MLLKKWYFHVILNAPLTVCLAVGEIWTRLGCSEYEILKSEQCKNLPSFTNIGIDGILYNLFLGAGMLLIFTVPISIAVYGYLIYKRFKRPRVK